MTDLAENPALARVVAARRLVERQRREARAIVLDGGITHPMFGPSFMRFYLPHYQRSKEGLFVPSAQWHAQMWRDLTALLVGEGGTHAKLAPRGYAKSTILMAFGLAVMAKQLRDFLWVIQDTGEQARQSMEGLTAETNQNESLRRDFPHLAVGIDKRRNRPVSDRTTDVVFASGQRVQAFGSGMKVRGRKQRQFRPDLVLIDDLENDQHVATKFQRDKLDNWVNSALLGALSEDAVTIMVGTLLHHDSVLARKLAEWPSARYEAMTDHRDFATTTWPEWWPAARLAATQKRMGVRAFSREFLHEPIDEEAQMFRQSMFKYRDTRQRLLEDHDGDIAAQLRLVVDPAFSERTQADYSAIAEIARVGHAPEYDVMGVWRGRVSGDKLIDKCVTVYQTWQHRRPIFLIESVAAQVWLAQALREKGLPVKEVRPVKDKVARAEPMAVMYENAQVWHDSSLRNGEYEQELTTFPMGDHDDQVDVVVYGVTDLAVGQVEVSMPVGEIGMAVGNNYGR